MARPIQKAVTEPVTEPVTDAQATEAWKAYAKLHFQLENSVPTPLELAGMKAALSTYAASLDRSEQGVSQESKPGE